MDILKYIKLLLKKKKFVTYQISLSQLYNHIKLLENLFIGNLYKLKDVDM